jgi:hypothetical protein
MLPPSGLKQAFTGDVWSIVKPASAICFMFSAIVGKFQLQTWRIVSVFVALGS